MRRTRSTRLSWVAAASALTIVVAGCTGDDGQPDDGGTTSGSSTESPTDAPFELADRSADILAFTMDQEPIAETHGAWEGAARNLTGASTEVTVRVYALDAYESTTRLTFDFFYTDGGTFTPNIGLYWGDFPRLIVEDANQALLLNHYRAATEDDRTSPGRGLIPIATGERTDFAPLTAQYPPLPPGTTEIEIATPGLPDLTVPVTWHTD